MTSFTHISGTNVCCPFATGQYTVVTTGTGLIRHYCMIKGRYQPVTYRMAQITGFSLGIHMCSPLTAGNSTIVTGYTTAQGLGMIKS